MLHKTLSHDTAADNIRLLSMRVCLPSPDGALDGTAENWAARVPQTDQVRNISIPDRLPKFSSFGRHPRLPKRAPRGPSVPAAAGYRARARAPGSPGPSAVSISDMEVLAFKSHYGSNGATLQRPMDHRTPYWRTVRPPHSASRCSRCAHRRSCG